MVGWLKFNIIEKIPFMVYLEIQCITFKMEKSFIAHPWIQRSVVGLEEYSAHDWRAANSALQLLGESGACGHMDFEYPESEREQRNSGLSRSAHTPIKRISEHRDTISCHSLCCTNDLIDMKGRCCPKIVLSIPRSLFTSGQLRHIGGIVPKTALRYDGKFVKKSWHHKSLQMMNKWRITSMIVR